MGGNQKREYGFSTCCIRCDYSFCTGCKPNNQLMKKVAILFVILCLLIQTDTVFASMTGVSGKSLDSGLNSSLYQQKSNSTSSKSSGSFSRSSENKTNSSKTGYQSVIKPNLGQRIARKESRKNAKLEGKKSAKKECGKSSNSKSPKKSNSKMSGISSQAKNSQ
jgi:hypothetical protein